MQSNRSAKTQFTFGEEEEENSTFSIIDIPSIAAGPYSDEDGSYVAIDGCDFASVVSEETQEKEQGLDCGEQQHVSSGKAVCCICLEEKPLIRLMKKCRCHPSACKECLREMYIVHSLSDHSKYPLKCFWPGCDRPLRDVQVKKFAFNQKDVEKYYRFEAQGKSIASSEKRRHISLLAAMRQFPLYNYQTVQSCPNCQHGVSVRPYQSLTDAETQICCVICSTTFAVDKLPRSELASIFTALGDGLAGSCPRCCAFFVKDGGCDQMTCVCGREFSFLEQRSRFLAWMDSSLWCSAVHPQFDPRLCKSYS